MTKPTAKELHAAAQRLVDGYLETMRFACPHADAEEMLATSTDKPTMLARHVLATVHEDDDEPIRVDWLVTLGGRYASDIRAVDFVLHPPDPESDFSGTTARILCYEQDDWVCELFDSDKSPCDGIGFGRFRTRGQVRKLFDVLGIAHDKTRTP